MKELIERLEKVTEGSEELDAAIAQKVRGIREWYVDVPAYTTSLDAALTLVPKDTVIYYWGWSIQHCGVGFAVGAQVWKRYSVESAIGPQEDCLIVRAATPALALCIAALKALTEPCS